MRLEKHEYDIVDEAINDGGVGIFITKEALEKMRNRYKAIAKRNRDLKRFDGMYYAGKSDAFADLLKLFEEEGV